MDRLYSELTGSIDASINSTIRVFHGLSVVPDDVEIHCTDSIPDQPTFSLLEKTDQHVLWKLSGTSRTIGWRAWTRKNHSIIDGRVEASYRVEDGAAALSPHDALKTRCHYDFGTAARSLAA